MRITRLIIMMAIATLAACSNAEVSNTSEQPKFETALTEAEKADGVLTPEILWKFGRIGSFDISSDGELIVFSVSKYDVPTNKSNADIFTIPVKGGEPTQLTDNIKSEYLSKWMGEKITYMLKGQIWSMNADGSNKVQISDVEGGINSYTFATSGNKLMYIKDVKLDDSPTDIYTDMPKANVVITDDLMYRHWDTWHDYKYSHVFVADFDGTTLSNHTDIMEGEKFDAPLSPYFDDSDIAISVDGNLIAYTSKKLSGKDAAVSTNSDVYLYNVAKKTTVNLTEGNMGFDKNPTFSPDGTKIVYLSMETPGWESDKERMMILDIASGEKEYTTKDWDQNAHAYHWDVDGNIYFISGINATYQVYSYNCESKNITQLTKGQHNYNAFIKSGSVIIGSKTTHSLAAELFSVNAKDVSESQVTNVNKEIYDNITMGKTEERWVETTDGKKMLVWVIYPPNFDPNKKYPTLLYCQGGPQSAVSQFFSYRWNFQMMVANDYIVVAPNRRGLPTFGGEWNAQISKDYGGQNMKDYLTAIDELAKEPFIDEDRLGAVGASYGGFSVFYLAGHHDKRFKALISHCGMFNFESWYSCTEETFFPNQDIGGGYWETPKPKSYEFSPHLAVNKWDTPILIFAGEHDYRIPYTQSLEAYGAAQLQGVPSKLVLFHDETHFVVKPQNAIVWQREFAGWLDKWLK